MSELKEILIRKQALDGIDSMGTRPQKAINFSDMDISELRGMASFIYEQYQKTCEEKEQLLKTQDILISQSEDNKKALDEIKGLLIKNEKERDWLKSQLDTITAKLTAAMDIISKMSKENARLKKENRNLKEENNVLKENTFGSKSHKVKRNKPDTGATSEGDESTNDDNGASTPNDTEQAETSPVVKEKETRPYRKGMKYNTGGVKNNVILHLFSAHFHSFVRFHLNMSEL